MDSIARGISNALRTQGYSVTLAGGETHKIEASDVYIADGGTLVLKKGAALVVAFGPGCWVEIQEA